MLAPLRHAPMTREGAERLLPGKGWSGARATVRMLGAATDESAAKPWRFGDFRRGTLAEAAPLVWHP